MENNIFLEYLDIRVSKRTRKEFVDYFTGKTIPINSTVYHWKRRRFSVTHHSLTKPICKNDMYYLQNGWSGNSILWWQKSTITEYNGGAGYTTDINKAAIFTKDWVEKHLELNRGEKKYKCIDVDFHSEKQLVVTNVRNNKNEVI